MDGNECAETARRNGFGCDEETELIEDSKRKRKFRQKNIARIRRRSWHIKALIR